jgi:hypothetical protein
MRDIAHDIDGRRRPNGRCRACWLIDVAVIEDELCAPDGIGVEAVFPADTDNVPFVVTAQLRLAGSLRDLLAILAVNEYRDRAAAGRAGRAATALERVLIELAKR